MSEDSRRILQAFFISVEDGLSLLEAEPALLNARTGLGETILHYLAVENQIEAVKALVEKKGADVNTVNDFGGSPLSETASLGYIEMVKCLLSKGAELQVPGQEKSVLFEAVRSGNGELIQVLLKAGADVHENDLLDGEPLHVATEENSIEIVGFLLAAGADPNAKRNAGETPLHIAAEKDRVEIVKLLLAAGGDPEAKEFYDETPLDIAIRCGATRVRDEIRGFAGEVP